MEALKNKEISESFQNDYDQMSLSISKRILGEKGFLVDAKICTHKNKLYLLVADSLTTIRKY